MSLIRRHPNAIGGSGGFHPSLVYLLIIQTLDGWGSTSVPPLGLAHQKYQSTTNHITYLLLPVPQSHVVDTNTPNFPLVFYNNTIFHNGAAENHVSTVPGGSVHEKEFLYTTLWSCRYPIQSENHGDDNYNQQHHNIHELALLSSHGEQSQHQFYDVGRSYSENQEVTSSQRILE